MHFYSLVSDSGLPIDKKIKLFSMRKMFMQKIIAVLKLSAFGF